jgi:diacylglycerol kinase (ATP)
MPHPDIPEQKRFSILKRAHSFAHAGRGLRIFLHSTHNAWIHLAVLVVAVALGIALHIAQTEWLILTLAAGFVLAVEAINTAIEIDIDLTSPQFHPYARDTKDVAAAAVLISAITAVIIGLIIFVPHLLALRK